MSRPTKKIGMIGHVDSGKHSLTAALLLAIQQAGIKVISVSDIKVPPTTWSGPELLDLEQDHHSGPKSSNPQNKCYSNRHKKSRY
jgi:hypothetical protein